MVSAISVLSIFTAFINPETGCIVPSAHIELPGYCDVVEPFAPGTGEWTGNGPWGGNLKGLAASESDNSIVIAGCGFSMTPDAGGVWRSSDGGISWTETELSPIPVNDVCSGGAAAPNTFYAATRTGLYVSSDNGETWDTVSGMSSSYVIGIGVSSADPDLLIAGLSSNNGIRRSTDGGNTWQEVGLSSGYMKGFGCDPEHPDTMYVAMSGGDYSLYRSLDAGASWSSIGPSGSGWGVLVAPFGTGETVIVTTSDGFYISTNYGSSWDLVVSGSSYAPAVCDGSTLFAPVISAGGVYESTDGGASWVFNSQGIVASYWQAGCASSIGYLAGHYGGVYRTTGAGGNYTVSQAGIGNGYFRAVFYDPSTNTLLAGGDYHGLWKSIDNGQNWNIVFPGPPNWTIYDIAPGSDHGYLGQVRYIASADGILRSDDGGDNWIPAGFSGTQVSSVAFDPTDPDKAWAGTASAGVHYTIDGGETWTPGTGFPFALYPSVELIDLPSGDLRVLVSFQNNGEGVYYSDDGGASYTLAPVSGSYHPGLSARWGTDPMAYLSTDNGIYRSADRGESWEACPGSSGLMWSVEGSVNGNVFGGTNGSGVKWSPDQGETWQSFSNGIENRVVWDICYGDNSNQLFAALRGFGVVEITDEQLGIETGDLSGASLTFTASPNPATSSVQFLVSGIDEGTFDLSIYTVTGRLLHRESINDTCNSRWTPGIEVPAGVYLVRVSDHERAVTSKLIFVR